MTPLEVEELARLVVAATESYKSYSRFMSAEQKSKAKRGIELAAKAVVTLRAAGAMPEPETIL